MLPQYQRAPRFHYALAGLCSFPKRLFCPVDPGVATVRSFKITPKFQIKLDDVLSGRHLPPLGLKEFEEYLLWIERSAENLYFYFWLKNYEESAAKSMDMANMTLLINSYACAKATFFDPQSPFELNLPSDMMSSILKLTAATPAPEEFRAVKAHVTSMMQHSLAHFVSRSSRNANRARGCFAIVVGLLVIAIGLIPIVLSFTGRSRWLCLSAVPAFWIGASTLIAGLHGICIIIFLFGDARQLHPFELLQPASAAASRDLGPLDAPEKGDIASLRPTEKGPHLHVELQRCRSPASSHEGDSARDIKVKRVAAPIETIAPFLYAPSSPTESTYAFSSRSSDMDSLYDGASSIFAPMARVLSPIALRGQWTVVVRSLAVGLTLALLIAGLLTAVPRRH